MTQNLDRDLEYLQAVLSWLDTRLEREVRLWQLAGQNPGDRFRGLYISDEEALSLSQRGVASHWGSGVRLPKDGARALEKAQAAATKTVQALEDQAEGDGQTLRLKALREIFGLSDFEWWAFVVALAPALDLRFERIYSYLQDDVTRKFPSVDLLMHILLPEGLRRLEHLHHFDRDAALRAFKLLLPVEDSDQKFNGLRKSFYAAPGVVDWLLGAYSATTALGDWAEFYPATDDAEEMANAQGVFEIPGIPTEGVILDIKPVLSLCGEDILQQELTVRQLAIALGRPLLKIRLRAGESDPSPLEMVYAAVRDARMLKALLYVQGVDVFIDEDGCLLPAFFAALRLTDDCVLTSS